MLCALAHEVQNVGNCTTNCKFTETARRVPIIGTIKYYKFITVKIVKSKTEQEEKKIAFSIANSNLVKTAITGEDPNWGRIIMAIGKSGININLDKLSINFGNIKIIEKGKIFKDYKENEVANYMKFQAIDISINLNSGIKNFTAYTMDLTKKYIEINADYRS